MPIPNDVRFSLANNIGVYYLQKGEMLGQKYLKMASDIAINLNEPEKIAQSNLNYSFTLEISDTIKVMENEVLPIILEYNLIYLLPSIYFNLGCYKRDNNFLIKAIESSILVGDYVLMLRAVSHVSSDSLPLYINHLADAFETGVDEKLISLLSVDEGVLFYGNLSLFYANNNDFVLAEKLAKKSIEIYLLSKDYDINQHYAACDVLIVLYSQQRRYHDLLEYINNNFTKIEEITRANEKGDILYRLAMGYYHIGESRLSEYYLTLLKEQVKNINDIDFVYKIQNFYFDIGKLEECLEAGSEVILRSKSKALKSEAYELMGSCYFNLRSYSLAKNCYFEASSFWGSEKAPSSAIFYNLALLSLKSKEIETAALYVEISMSCGGHDMQDNMISIKEKISDSIGNKKHENIISRVNAQFKLTENAMDFCKQIMYLDKNGISPLNALS